MSLPFLSTPPSCPCHFLGRSASFSMHVPFFRCESVPYISRRADWLPCPLFPFHSPCTPLVFISVPFMSLSVPLCFPFISRCCPLMSTSHFLPSFPCTSLHFPCAPRHFPQQNTVFPAQRGRPKTQRFSRFSANGERAGRGIRAWDPCLALAPRRLRLVERHQITARYVGDPPPRWGGGGVILYPLLGVRHAEQCQLICPQNRIRVNGNMGQNRPVGPKGL